jgi:hypothetical protein
MDNKELKRAGVRDTPERKSRCSFDQAAGQKMSRHADQSRSSAARQRRHRRRISTGRMITQVSGQSAFGGKADMAYCSAYVCF